VLLATGQADQDEQSRIGEPTQRRNLLAHLPPSECITLHVVLRYT
jgi:hypothetical protein